MKIFAWTCFWACHTTFAAVLRGKSPDHEYASSTELIVRNLSSRTNASGRPLSGERLAAFCYLKQRLMSRYVLDPMPKLLQGRKACAIVSSSGALLKHSHGGDIDAHEIVLRFNKAPVAGFAQHVGTKTSFRLGWDFPYGFPRDRCILYPDSYKPNATAALRHIFPGAKQNGIKPDVTSGFHGMLTALSNCGSLDGYEMTPSKAAADSSYSYYSDWGGANADTYNSWHGYFKAEHKLWSLLSTTPVYEIESSGRASYTCFHAVACASQASVLAQMKPEMLAFLDKIIDNFVH
jgi:hypothetical protein